MESLKEKVLGQITLAKKASRQMALQDRRAKDSALAAIAEQLQVDADDILTANEQDLARAEADGQPASYLDRLRLTPARIRYSSIDCFKDTIHESQSFPTCYRFVWMKGYVASPLQNA